VRDAALVDVVDPEVVREAAEVGVDFKKRHVALASLLGADAM